MREFNIRYTQEPILLCLTVEVLFRLGCSLEIKIFVGNFDDLLKQMYDSNEYQQLSELIM